MSEGWNIGLRAIDQYRRQAQKDGPKRIRWDMKNCKHCRKYGPITGKECPVCAGVI